MAAFSTIELPRQIIDYLMHKELSVDPAVEDLGKLSNEILRLHGKEVWPEGATTRDEAHHKLKAILKDIWTSYCNTTDRVKTVKRTASSNGVLPTISSYQLPYRSSSNKALTTDLATSSGSVVPAPSFVIPYRPSLKPTTPFSVHNSLNTKASGVKNSLVVDDASSAVVGGDYIAKKAKRMREEDPGDSAAARKNKRAHANGELHSKTNSSSHIAVNPGPFESLPIVAYESQALGITESLVATTDDLMDTFDLDAQAADDRSLLSQHLPRPFWQYPQMKYRVGEPASDFYIRLYGPLMVSSIANVQKQYEVFELTDDLHEEDSSGWGLTHGTRSDRFLV